MPPAAEPAVSPPLVRQPAGFTVPVGPGAEGVAVDPATSTVAVGDSAGVVLVGERGAPARTVALPAGPRHVRLAGPDGPFVVPAEGADLVAFVHPVSGRVESLVRVGRHPHDIALVGGTIFVGNELSDTLSVLRHGQVVATVPVVTQPGGLAAVAGRVAVVGVRARKLELMDARTLRAVAIVPAESGPSHVEADGRSLYVADTGGGALLVYRVSPHLQQVARIALGGSPYGMAVDAVRHRLWVTLTADNILVAFDLTGRLPRRVATIPTVRQPNTVALDASTGTLFVTGAAAGVLQIIPLADQFGQEPGSP
jgi:DNA-binding beta-propeller fold protein YncE